MGKFIQLFHDTPRDITQFGKVVMKSSGAYEYLEDLTDVVLDPNAPDTYMVGPAFRPMTQFHKLNIIEQACKDVMSCLCMISSVHQRSILEYCVWYRENHNLDTYSEYITKVASHCVVHNDFMAPNQTWTLVEFH